MSTSSCNQQKHHRLTFCSLLFRLKALLQVVNSFLQTELIFIPVISFSRKLLYNSVNNQEINLKKDIFQFLMQIKHFYLVLAVRFLSYHSHLFLKFGDFLQHLAVLQLLFIQLRLDAASLILMTNQKKFNTISGLYAVILFA